GVDEVETARTEPAQGAPGAEGVEGRDPGGAALHLLVRLQAAAVAQHLVALGRIAESDDIDTSVVPGGGKPRRMRREDGHPVAAARESQGEVADERAGGVPRKAGIGLGEEEKIEARAHSSHSLIE